MAKAAAVHLGFDGFEAVVLEGSSKRWKILGAEAGELAAPAEGEDPLGPTVVGLSGALKRLHAPHDPVALAVPSTSAVFRNLTLPFTGDDAIRKVLKFEAEGHLHQYNIDDVVVCHVPVTERKGATDVVIAAAPKKQLKPAIEALDRASYDPAVVDLDGLALFNLLLATGSVPEQGAVLVLHVGREATLALLVEDRRLRFVRSMRLGLGSLQRALAGDLGVAPHEARAKVKELTATTPVGSPPEGSNPEGNGSDEEASLVVTFDADEPRGELEKSPKEVEFHLVEDRRKELLRRLERETVRTIAAEARHGLSEVLVCGEGGAVEGLLEGLGAVAGAPVREVDLLANVDGAPADPTVRRRISLAVGVGLKLLGIDATGSEFRQEDLRYAKKLETLKMPLAAVLGVAAFAVILQNIYLWRETGARYLTLESIADEAKARAVGVMPKEKGALESMKGLPAPKRIENYALKLTEETKKYREMFGSGGALFTKPQSAFDAMQLFFAVLERHKDDLGLIVLDAFQSTTVDRPAGVTITFTMTFLGDDESTSRRLDMLRNWIRAEKWCVQVGEAKSRPVTGGGGRVAEGLVVKVDLQKMATP